MRATHELTPKAISEQLSDFANKEQNQIRKFGQGFVALVDREVAATLYSAQMSALDSDPHPRAKYIFQCFQPTTLPCKHEDLTRSPKTLTVWLIGDDGELRGAFQKLGDGQFITYPAQALDASGSGARLRKLLHQTLHQMREE